MYIKHANPIIDDEIVMANIKQKNGAKKTSLAVMAMGIDCEDEIKSHSPFFIQRLW